MRQYIKITWCANAEQIGKMYPLDSGKTMLKMVDKSWPQIKKAYAGMLKSLGVDTKGIKFTLCTLDE